MGPCVRTSDRPSVYSFIRPSVGLSVSPPASPLEVDSTLVNSTVTFKLPIPRRGDGKASSSISKGCRRNRCSRSSCFSSRSSSVQLGFQNFVDNQIEMLFPVLLLLFLVAGIIGFSAENSCADSLLITRYRSLGLVISSANSDLFDTNSPGLLTRPIRSKPRAQEVFAHYQLVRSPRPTYGTVQVDVLRSVSAHIRVVSRSC